MTTAAAVAVAVSTPLVGVGAVMTEAECAGATLLPLDEQQLAESPRLDTSTEAAAAGIDQTIVATQVCVRVCGPVFVVKFSMGGGGWV